MSSLSPATNQSTEKVLAGIDDESVSARYPNRTHFVAADHARHGEMVTRALFAGDPVVVVYPDGREVLFTPEQAHGMTALLLLLAVAWWRLQSRRTPADVVQLPPRTRVEARDSVGQPVAA